MASYDTRGTYDKRTYDKLGRTQPHKKLSEAELKKQALSTETSKLEKEGYKLVSDKNGILKYQKGNTTKEINQTTLDIKTTTSTPQKNQLDSKIASLIRQQKKAPNQEWRQRIQDKISKIEDIKNKESGLEEFHNITLKDSTGKTEKKWLNEKEIKDIEAHNRYVEKVNQTINEQSSKEGWQSISPEWAEYNVTGERNGENRIQGTQTLDKNNVHIEQYNNNDNNTNISNGTFPSTIKASTREEANRAKYAQWKAKMFPNLEKKDEEAMREYYEKGVIPRTINWTLDKWDKGVEIGTNVVYYPSDKFVKWRNKQLNNETPIWNRKAQELYAWQREAVPSAMKYAPIFWYRLGWDTIRSEGTNVVDSITDIENNWRHPKWYAEQAATIWLYKKTANPLEMAGKVPIIGDKEVISANKGGLVPEKSRAAQVEELLNTEKVTTITGRRKHFGNEPTNVPMDAKNAKKMGWDKESWEKAYVDRTYGHPIEFATWRTKQGVDPTSDLFTKRRLWKSGFTEIQGKIVIEDVKVVNLPDAIKSEIKEALYNGKPVKESTIKNIYDIAKEQANKINEPVAVISPKRLRNYEQPELELAKILPDNYVPKLKYFSGLSPKGIPIYTNLPPKKVLKKRLKQLKVDLVSGEFGFQKSIREYWAEIAKQKYESQVLGAKKEFAKEYGKHGREHIVEDFTKEKGGEKYDWGHDITKVSDQDAFSKYPHGETARMLVETGRFPDKSIYNLPLKKQFEIAEAFAGHEYYRPNLRTITRPDLKNLNKRMTHWFVGKFNKDLRRIASLDRKAMTRFNVPLKESLISPEWRSKEWKEKHSFPSKEEIKAEWQKRKLKSIKDVAEKLEEEIRKDSKRLKEGVNKRLIKKEELKYLWKVNKLTNVKEIADRIEKGLGKGKERTKRAIRKVVPTKEEIKRTWNKNKLLNEKDIENRIRNNKLLSPTIKRIEKVTKRADKRALSLMNQLSKTKNPKQKFMRKITPKNELLIKLRESRIANEADIANKIEKGMKKGIKAIKEEKERKKRIKESNKITGWVGKEPLNSEKMNLKELVELKEKIIKDNKEWKEKQEGKKENLFADAKKGKNKEIKQKEIEKYIKDKEYDKIREYVNKYGLNAYFEAYKKVNYVENYKNNYKENYKKITPYENKYKLEHYKGEYPQEPYKGNYETRKYKGGYENIITPPPKPPTEKKKPFMFDKGKLKPRDKKNKNKIKKPKIVVSDPWSWFSGQGYGKKNIKYTRRMGTFYT